MIGTPADRLQAARRNAGFSTPVAAARAFGWNENSYKSHENGTRGIRKTVAERYARAFHVSPGWILTGEQGSSHQTADEAELLALYRALPENEREIVRLLCESLVRRQANGEPAAPIRRVGGR